MTSNNKLNHEAWARSMIGFIRERGLESEFQDWCGGWPCRVASPEIATMPLPSHEPDGQQAGKAEKLAEEYMRDIEDYSIFDNMDNQEQAAAAFQWLLSRATPQPTERERIVAWLREQDANRTDRVGSVMSGGGREYDIGRATGYAHAADAIERGEHLAGDKA